MAMIINKPYIEKREGGKVRLCSRIEGSINDVLYYEVDEKYEQYLCDDRADAFLLGLLNCAMYENQDIDCRADITGELLFQLRTYYIPILAKTNPDFHNITVQAQEAQTQFPRGTAVVTGNSGGVDSLYTILKYSKTNMGAQGVTHLLFNNISTADRDDARIRSLFERDRKEKAQVAQELGLEFVALYSNLYSMYKKPGLFNMYYAAPYASAAYALAKLFGSFYFSSAYPVEEFSLSMSVVNKGHDSACYDLFSLHCFSSGHLSMYSTGMEVTRNEKVSYIADFETVQKHLQVCAIEQDAGVEVHLEKINCGQCRKCRRTILQLEAINKLDAFASVFDLSAYKKNPGKFIGKGLAADLHAFSHSIKQQLRQQNKLPANEWLWELLYRFRYFLSKSNFLVKCYHSIKGK